MSTCGDSGGRSNTETSLDELQAPLVETFIDEEHSDNNHDDNFWNNEIDDHDHEDDDDYVYYDDDFESIEEITNTEWREPSKDAVNMSLRAEKETSGSKRRLAQDLYRIMIQDTQDAGFALRPTTEDCLDEWIVNLFNFDEDSRLAKDMLVLGVASIELSMSFPEQYPFEPPFVCILKPRFERSTGFVIKGALCMELLTKNGWNPINDIESVIVSIRSLISEGRGRLEAAVKLEQTKYNELLDNAKSGNSTALNDDMHTKKRQLKSVDPYDEVVDTAKNKKPQDVHQEAPKRDDAGDAYSVDVAKTTFAKISELHDKEGWSKSWVKRG